MSLVPPDHTPSRVRWRRSFPELALGVGPLVEALRAGFPVSRVDVLASVLGLTSPGVADALSVSASTLRRRRRAGRLDLHESGRAYRLVRIVDRAADVFGSVEVGVERLNRPQFALGEAAPLTDADAEPGAREVENAPGRIEHGVAA